MYTNNALSMTNDYIPDARAVLLVLWRHRRLMAIIVAVSMVIGLAIISIMPKNYTASAIVVLNKSGTEDLQDFYDATSGGTFDEMTMQTEVSMLTSPSLALQTIRATDLGKNPEFAADSEQNVLRAFAGHLHVNTRGQSRTIEVSFESRDPELAAKVVNAHVEAYLEAQINFKTQQVEQLSQWFRSKVEDLKTDVSRKSQAVQDFRAEQDLPLGKDDKELIYQEISDVATQLVPVQVHKDEVLARLSAIEAASKSNRPDALSDVVSSPLIQNLKAQASVTAQTVQSLSAQYGSNHPKLAAAQRELDQVNRAIATETANIKSSLKNHFAATEGQEEALNARLADLNTRADEMRTKLVTLKSLQVEQDASQKVLDNFMENYKNIQSQATLARPDAVVVSSATAPGLPSSPGKSLLAMIAAVFSGSLALAAVFGVETMRSGVQNFEDVRKLSQKPLGIVPQIVNPAHAILGGAQSSYREAIKRIYMSGLLNNPARTILVTSAMPKEGRTTFTLSLAWYLMSLGRKVVVIDADFLKPSLSALTGLPDGLGFTDVLAGRATLDDVIGTDKNGLPVIRVGSQALRSPDVLDAEKLRQIFAEIRRRFDYVLIDSGPLLARAEAGVIAAEADGVLVVTRWLKTSQENIAGMFEVLKDSGTPVLGVVINKVDIAKYRTVVSGSDFLLPKTANAA